MTDTEPLAYADESFTKGMALYKECKPKEAKGAFRTAYQLYRKYDKHGKRISDAAFFLAQSIVEYPNNNDELLEAEDLLIRFRDDETPSEEIPRIFILGKVYTLLGRSKLMHLVCAERICEAETDEERAFALAGAVYAAIPGTTRSYQYAKDALPLLHTMGSHSEAMTYVLESMARAAKYVSPLDRLSYAEQLLALLKQLPPHPRIPSLYEVYMLLSYIYMEQSLWCEAVSHTKLALNYAAVNGNKHEVSSTYMHLAKIYKIMNKPAEAAKAHFCALKAGIVHCDSNLLSYSKELSDVARQLAQHNDYRLSVSAQLLSLRYLVDSDDFTYDQIRENIITLHNYEHNLI